MRKVTPKLITEEEVAVVEKGIRDHAKLKHFFVEVQKDALVVYLPNEKVAALEEAGSPFVGFDLRSLPDVERFLTYSPMMRFVLVDEEQRLFITERWCFLGSIDTWIHLSAAARLTSLLKKYGPHLGKESFFELMWVSSWGLSRGATRFWGEARCITPEEWLHPTSQRSGSA